jgi:hypothetical protein
MPTVNSKIRSTGDLKEAVTLTLLPFPGAGISAGNIQERAIEALGMPKVVEPRRKKKRPSVGMGAFARFGRGVR